MFSKQLEYSYLMYMYLKENPERYIFSSDIVEKTNVPKRWGRILLGNMVSKGLITSKKCKGFMFIERDVSFWEFYILVEENLKNPKEGLSENISRKNEQKYRNMILKIGSKVQKEMLSIKV